MGNMVIGNCQQKYLNQVQCSKQTDDEKECPEVPS